MTKPPGTALLVPRPNNGSVLAQIVGPSGSSSPHLSSLHSFFFPYPLLPLHSFTHLFLYRLPPTVHFPSFILPSFLFSFYIVLLLHSSSVFLTSFTLHPCPCLPITAASSPPSWLLPHLREAKLIIIESKSFNWIKVNFSIISI